MNKYTRLLALLLAFAIPLGYAPHASAMPFLCGPAERYLANSDNITSSMYGWWAGYYIDHCGGGY
jgi:hypothetical protein